jgi:peptidoglycan-N-acetylglucosamine deacetylase
MMSVWTRTRLRSNTGGTVLLTYDDGPGGSLTPEVMKRLDAYNAKATFFLLGKRAEACPGVADALAAAGHEMGCHTHHHLNAWKTPPWRAWADVERGYETLSPWVAADGVFRPPYGKATPLTLWQLSSRRAPIVWWTHDSGDTTHGDLPQVSDVVDGVVGDKGGVVLMHDFDRQGDPSYCARRAEFVLEVTEGLLGAAKSHGWRVATVSELIGRAG